MIRCKIYTIMLLSIGNHFQMHIFCCGIGASWQRISMTEHSTLMLSVEHVSELLEQ